MTARCSKCRATKPVEAFSPDKRRPSGVAARCKVCRAADARQGTARAPLALVVDFPPRPAPPLEEIPPTPAGVHAVQLERTLATAGLTDADAAAVSVVRTLAGVLDRAHVMCDEHMVAVISPKYLAALKALRLTRESVAVKPDIAPPMFNAAGY